MFQASASNAAAPAAAAVVPDPAIVEQLLGMGFDVNGCKKAAFHTNNSGFEAAVNWIMSHMEDPDFAAPYVQPGASSSSGAASSFVPNADGLAMLEAMGMPTKKCIKALKETDNNVERAVDWIFRCVNSQTKPLGASTYDVHIGGGRGVMEKREVA